MPAAAVGESRTGRGPEWGWSNIEIRRWRRSTGRARLLTPQKGDANLQQSGKSEKQRGGKTGKQREQSYGYGSERGAQQEIERRSLEAKRRPIFPLPLPRVVLSYWIGKTCVTKGVVPFLCALLDYLL